MLENEAETAPKDVAETAVAEPSEQAKKTRATRTAGRSATPAEAGEKTMSTAEILVAIKKMTVLELSELVKTLESEFGVTAAAPVVAMAATAAAPAAAAPAEEQTEFTVILKEIGANKINVIRAVRELTTLGLKESKDLVEGAPKPVKEGVNKDEAMAAKQKLEEAGATAEIR